MLLNISAEIAVGKYLRDRLIDSVFFLWLPDFNSTRQWEGKKYRCTKRIIFVHTFSYLHKMKIELC